MSSRKELKLIVGDKLWGFGKWDGSVSNPHGWRGRWCCMSGECEVGVSVDGLCTEVGVWHSVEGGEVIDSANFDLGDPGLVDGVREAVRNYLCDLLEIEI